MEEDQKKQKTALELKPAIRQETILAPQLRASLRILQLDAPSLADAINHEAENNPVVEIERPDDIPTDLHEPDERADYEEPLESDDYDDYSSAGSINEEASNRRQRFFDRQSATESLQEHLQTQVNVAGFSQEDRQLAELIVGDVDDDGRYVGEMNEVTSVTGASKEKFMAVLERIQSFDPPGVAARSLQECLLIQARQYAADARTKSAVLRILDGHLGLVARRDSVLLANKLKITQEECNKALKVICSFEPKPGRQFTPAGKMVQYIRPEVEVEITENGIVLNSCEHVLPKITINPAYRDMAEAADTNSETKEYLRERINSAESLQEAIRRRGETVMKVAEAVLSEQYGFFQNGFESLKPLTIEEIAHRTGFHGTTVGRAVRGKYVRTPKGVFELKTFFCVGKIDNGENVVSAAAVKCQLGELINSDRGLTMADIDLARELRKRGLNISRRTVTKYRLAMGIPTVAERKRRRNEYEPAL